MADMVSRMNIEASNIIKVGFTLEEVRRWSDSDIDDMLDHAFAEGRYVSTAIEDTPHNVSTLLDEFNCNRCARCCTTIHYIELSDKETRRIADHMGVDFESIYQRTELISGHRIAKAPCTFYEEDTGCTVHPAKPDVCYRWPITQPVNRCNTNWIMINPWCDAALNLCRLVIQAWVRAAQADQ